MDSPDSYFHRKHKFSYRLRMLHQSTIYIVGSVLLSLLISVVWSILLLISFLTPPLWATVWIIVVGFLFCRIHIMQKSTSRKRNYANLRLRPLQKIQLKWLGILPIVIIGLDYNLIILHEHYLSMPDLDEKFNIFDEYIEEYFGWLPIILWVCILAPFIEEVIFRGWIQRSLENKWGPIVAISLTAILFSFMHMIPAVFGFFSISGLIYGSVVYFTRSLWAGILLHIIGNSIKTLLDIFEWHPSYNEEWIPDSTTLLLATFSAVIFLVIIIAVIHRLWKLRFG